MLGCIVVLFWICFVMGGETLKDNNVMRDVDSSKAKQNSTTMYKKLSQPQLNQDTEQLAQIVIDWISIFGDLLGGFCLFMYGMRVMSEALKSMAGEQLKEVLSALSSNPIMALVSGIFVTALLQSSALVSVMIVSFVSSGYMTFEQSIIVLLGAGIGTTITSQLVAFNISKFSLYFVSLGFALAFSHKKKTQDYGKAVFGLGLIFYGISVMSKSMIPLRTYPPFLELLIKMSNPILSLLVSIVFTAVIQSSTAVVGIIIVLTGQSLITLKAAVCMVLGANVGTAITALLASASATREAQRVAVANILTKVIGAVLLLPLLNAFLVLVESTSPEPPRQVANAHTIFNIAIAVIFFPFIKQLSQGIDKLLPDLDDESV